jgi:hypothetical protein
MAAPAPSPASVRYEGAGPRERGFLLRALVEAWHNKCYWCNTSGDQSEFEIDHLVPPGKADEGIAKYNLPVGFDVQSPENLAPICVAGSRCNQRKSDRIFDDIGNGMVVTALRKARRLAPSVERNVRGLRTSRGLSKAIDAVLGAKLDEKSRTTIQQQGRGLIQRLYAVDHALVEDASTPYRHQPAADLDLGEFPGCSPEDLGDVIVELDGSGRSARAVLEVVCDIKLGVLVDDLLRGLFGLVDETVVERGPTGDFWGPFYVVGFRGVSVTKLSASREEDFIQMHLQGLYGSVHSASVFGLDDEWSVSADEVGSCWISVDGKFSATGVLPLHDDWDHELEIDISEFVFDRADDYDTDGYC